MRINFEEARIYVRPGSTDLRKGVSGLCSIIVNEMNLDALCGSAFLFCNKTHRHNPATEKKYWNKEHPEHRIELCNCNIHARRKFADSVKTTKSPTAQEAVRRYGKIFDAEKRLREQFQKHKITEEQYLSERQEKVLPLFNDFHEWLQEKDEKEKILGSSKTAEAIKYCLNRWDNLVKFLDYSYVTPDTNAAERAIKPFVMARKNFLFSGSGKGAESSCFLFSLIETTKFNGKSPEDYLRCLFEKAPYAETEEDWEKLLPWNIEITPFQFRGEWMDSTDLG